MTELEGENPQVSTEGKVVGVDLGLKYFAVVSDGSKVSKFNNPKHLAKHEKNLKRKQQKLAKKLQSSNSRHRYKKVVARVYERVSNSRQDFLHKLSRKTQAEATELLEIDQPKVCALINGKLSAFSTVRLFRFLNALGRDVETD